MADLVLPDPSRWINAYETGREGAMTRRKQEALSLAGRRLMTGDWEGAAGEVLPHDLATGVKLREMGAEEAARSRRAGYGRLVAEGKGDDAVRGAHAAGDLDEATKLQQALTQMDEAKREQVKARSERQAAILFPARQMDQTQRKAYVLQNKAALVEAGFTPEEVDAFDPSDAAYDQLMVQVMGLKDAIAKWDNDRTFAATEADRKGDNARADRMAAIAARRAELAAAAHQARLKAGGYGTPGVGSTVVPDRDVDPD